MSANSNLRGKELFDKVIKKWYRRSDPTTGLTLPQIANMVLGVGTSVPWLFVNPSPIETIYPCDTYLRRNFLLNCARSVMVFGRVLMSLLPLWVIRICIGTSLLLQVGHRKMIVFCSYN